MNHIIAIAKNTWKEAVRDRIFYGIVALAVLFLAILSSLSAASLGEDAHILKSVGLGGIYFFGVFLALFLGASLLGKEIDQKTLYFVLSRPVSRGAVITGKFLGLLASVLSGILLLSLAYFLALYFKGIAFSDWGGSVLAILFQMLESMLLIAIIIFFSTFLRPALAIFASFVVVFTGHSLTTIVSVAEKIHSSLGSIALLFSYIFPNLEKFNIRNDILYHFSLPPVEIFFTLVYAILGTIFALFLATLIFEKREL